MAHHRARLRTRTIVKKEDDLISSLTFVPLSEIQKDKGDRMQTVRTKFATALGKQRKSAQKFVDNPDRKLSDDEKPIFTQVGDKYVIEPRYGRRKVVLVEGSAIVVGSMEEVVSTIDKIIASVNNKAPSVDTALVNALAPKKKAEAKAESKDGSKEDKPNPASASGSSASGRSPKAS